MTTQPDLKPCPFCGHVGVTFRSESDHDVQLTNVFYSCGSCDASAEATSIPHATFTVEMLAEAKIMAMEKWNRRSVVVPINHLSRNFYELYKKDIMDDDGWNYTSEELEEIQAKIKELLRQAIKKLNSVS